MAKHKETKKGIIYIHHLPTEKRKRTKELLEKMKANLVGQNEKYHELFLAPNERAIQVIEDTLKRNQKTHILKSINECEDCLDKTTARYREIHNLFKGNEDSRH